MAKKNKKNRVSVEEAVKASHRRANIAVIIVAVITALILITIAVFCAVRVDPLDGIAAPDESKSECYYLYDRDSSTPLVTTKSAQSKIRTALGSMDFSVMSAVQQWNWDYSYNFVRNSSDNKISLTADDVIDKTPSSNEYMVEYAYTGCVVGGELDKSLAKKLTVDGETIYFDRLKVIISDTKNGVGEIYLYPYVYAYVQNNAAEGGERREAYRMTPVKVRANTTEAYAALGKIVEELKSI